MNDPKSGMSSGAPYPHKTRFAVVRTSDAGLGFECRAKFERMAMKLTTCLDRARNRISADWQRLLSHAPTDNPLAEPSAMYHQIRPTLDRFRQRLDGFELQTVKPVVRGRDTWPPHCHCGLNPYLEFYVRGERAVMAYFQLQAWLSPEALQWVRDQFRIVAMEDIRGFGGVCRRNPAAKQPSPIAQ